MFRAVINISYIL